MERIERVDPSVRAFLHVDGDKLRAAGVDLEQTANPLQRTPTVLKRGTDFDQVVLGISIGGLKAICVDIAGERDPFRRLGDALRVRQVAGIVIGNSKFGVRSSKFEVPLSID